MVFTDAHAPAAACALPATVFNEIILAGRNRTDLAISYAVSDS